VRLVKAISIIASHIHIYLSEFKILNKARPIQEMAARGMQIDKMLI
jgi:hypothetical protein